MRDFCVIFASTMDMALAGVGKIAVMLRRRAFTALRRYRQSKASVQVEPMP